MFWLAVLQTLIPKRSFQSLAENGNTTTCTRDALNQSFHRIPAHVLVERMNRGLSLRAHGLPYDAQCEQLSKALCGWAVKGFPCTKDRLEQEELVKHMYGVVMEFLLPLQQTKGKANSSLWKLAFTSCHVVGMHYMWLFAMKRSQLRVMLRACHHGFQRAMLCHLHEHSDWRLYWKHLFKIIWRSVPEKSAQYFVWASQQKVFYIGKANIERKTVDKLGVVARFKEDVANSFKVDDASYVARRYRL